MGTTTTTAAPTTTPNIAFVRDEVAAMVPRWDRIRDALSGQDAIKDHDRRTVRSGQWASRYLPMPNASDQSEQNQIRYAQYIERAVWYAVTGRTHRGMVGQVFQKDPVLELPTLLEQLETDIDGGGVSLAQQASKALGFVVGFGRGGLLTDYPTTEEPASRADQQAGKLRPTVCLYDPWSIINWRVKSVGSQQILTLVVLSETYSLEDDGFELKCDDQYRVLELLDADEFDEGGALLARAGEYRVGIWRRADGKTEWEEAEVSYPKDSSGAPLRYIPFQFLGALNNDPAVDLPPLGDLVDLNVAHYRNSADYEESVYIVGQPTPWAAGLTQTWVDKNFANGVQLGSRATMPLPAGGSCGLLQAAPNTLPKEAMEAKERQMVALGARLVEQRQVQRTATEARQEQAAELSTLGMCSRNVAAAYVQALAWAGAFVGTDEPATFELDPDAALRQLSPDELREVVAAWQGKALATSEMRAKLRAAGLATLSDDDYKSEIESEPSYGLPPAAAALLARAGAGASAGAKPDMPAEGMPPATA